ncbi:IS5 family transposase [Streptomyces sp. NPDC086147]|uniref:IS5 family transposase n=1 Tax=Streptomyces sp. NPDC086147 TaxID=3155295 RepID=UPI00344FE0A3
MINGVSWWWRTGSPRRGLPERYGPWQTAYERFVRWEADGTWARLLEQVQVRHDSVGAVERTVSVDSTISRAHQRAVGARKKRGGGRTGRSGKSVGRSGTRSVPWRADHKDPPRLRRPGSTAGRRHGRQRQRLDRLRHRHDRAEGARTGVGCLRRRPDTVIADRAYSSRAIRQVLRRRGIQAVIPERADQKANRLRRGKTGGRPPSFNGEPHEARNVVERCSNGLKKFRAIASRFDELAARYKAGVHLASLFLRLRESIQDPLSDTPCAAGGSAACGGRSHHLLPVLCSPVAPGAGYGMVGRNTGCWRPLRSGVFWPWSAVCGRPTHRASPWADRLP